MTYRKKLIEVALPLEAINREAAREKSIRHGHPSTLHLWWARRPLAACRAVLFASLVDDPSARPEDFPTEEAQEAERQRLFRIIEELVKWENSNNERVLQSARNEILRSCDGKPPPVYDPFCGGGSIPLEAQRLGLEAHASDLNPVAVLITKALIEIPPKFAGKPPVNPVDSPRMSLTANGRELTRMGDKGKDAAKNPSDSRPLASIRGAALLAHEWKGAAGLAADIRYYGQWMRDEAEKRIGHLYPKVHVMPDGKGGYRHATPEERAAIAGTAGSADIPVGEPRRASRDAGAPSVQELTVIAWLWARTVASPNPAAKGAHVPLVRSFWLSTKAGKKAWVEPVVDQSTMTYRFETRTRVPLDTKTIDAGTKSGRGANFRCVLTGSPIPGDYIKSEAMAGRLRTRMMAVVVVARNGRVYIAPDIVQEQAANVPVPDWQPDQELADDPRNIWCRIYGLDNFSKLYTRRQITALNAFCGLVSEARAKVLGETDGDSDYADGVASFLGLLTSRFANYMATLCVWSSHAKDELAKQVFLRQALPMTWDFAETNPFCSAGGSFDTNLSFFCRTVGNLPATRSGTVLQCDAMSDWTLRKPALICTDPPYYDNISYANLSDFFYVWMRRCLQSLYPDVLGTVLVPKTSELVADPYRQGGVEKAQMFFVSGMERVLKRMHAASDPRFPTTIFYAFKQAEDDDDSADTVESESLRASTGWETFLQGLVDAGWQIDGTWPMRTELVANLKRTINALASSIVLVCRPRPKDAGVASRRDFLAALKKELPEALRHLQKGNIAPVDLAQAAIGPGMAVFSRYARVLETDGSPMSVRTALALINQSLDEVLAEQEGEFDADTRWAIAWFDQFGFEEGPFGVAETLSKAKNTSVGGMVEAGILSAKAGKVRLLKREELAKDWDPATDARLTIWEITHHLIRRLEQGESAAAAMLGKLGAKGETARDLSYRLYTFCERRKRAQDAIAYNSLVLAWPDILRLAEEQKRPGPSQGKLQL